MLTNRVPDVSRLVVHDRGFKFHRLRALGAQYDGTRLAASSLFDDRFHLWDLRVFTRTPAELLTTAERETGLRVEGLGLTPIPQNRLEKK